MFIVNVLSCLLLKTSFSFKSVGEDTYHFKSVGEDIYHFKSVGEDIIYHSSLLNKTDLSFIMQSNLCLVVCFMKFQEILLFCILIVSLVEIPSHQVCPSSVLGACIQFLLNMLVIFFWCDGLLCTLSFLQVWSVVACCYPV